MTLKNSTKNLMLIAFVTIITIGCGKRKAEVIYHNCDPDGMWGNTKTIQQRPDAHSGGFVSVIDSTTEFSLTLNKQMNELVNGLPKTITVSSWVRFTTMDAKASLVVSIEKDGKAAMWESMSVDKIVREPNKWYLVSKKFKIGKDISLDNLLKVYVWNNSKQEIWVDDIKVEAK